MSNLLLENISHEDLKKYIQEYYSYAKKVLKLHHAPKLFLQKDQNNANDLLGKTGYYDPQKEEIYLFISDRHAKDIIRSFAHELIHHNQKLKGFDEDVDLSITGKDPSYALHDKKLREMEREAFERGNMMFRDWTDTKKMEKNKVMNEKKSSKPDYLDLDKDGNKKETMKKAIKDSNKETKKDIKMKQKNKKEEQKMEEVKSIDQMMKGGYGPGMSDFDKSSGLRKGASSLSDIDTSDEAGIEDIEDLELDDEEGEVEDKPKRSSAPVEKDQDARIANQLRDRYPELYKKLSRELSPADAYLQRRGEEAEDMYDEDDYGSKAGRSSPMRGPKGPLPEEQLQETKQNPYPTLFEQRERLLNEAFKTKEERIYNELIRRFIKK